ncbi:helix-turn-helix domain-containing protein [Actomonas aquatica]|uniref:AraC family transcriptional regulator n=1 Tax=Actomonas aquatica TaxID=2866162 RepID=A0ABZ1CDD1_9BACT|nr:AraC family transcriptional regulator [Opitutus sp. WL0086]WRQ89569.1 AraC family transcriptional regulator [Opitutus sp. WL0086]
MPEDRPFQNDPWITRPLTVGGGVIRAAGLVHNVPALDPAAMRELGTFGLIYMVRVDGFYCDANGVQESLQSGDVVWIQPGLAHAYGPRTGRDWTQIYVVMEGSPWTEWAAQGVLLPHRPITRAAPVDLWRRRFERVFEAHGAGERATALRTHGALMQLVLDLLATHAEAQRAPGDAWLEESQRLLGDVRPGHAGLTPHEVARKVGLSYENFRKQFAARTGRSPGQFQKRRRIERACAAIYQGEHSFKHLAVELGFCDVFHFSKAFKQVVGETPSDFRQRTRGH